LAQQANVTSVFTKVVLPSYELLFSKTKNVTAENIVKIDKKATPQCKISSSR
jgi:hypothetical protein